MDRNSLIGLGLIAVILGVWLYISGPTKEQIARSKRIKDSLEQVKLAADAQEKAKAAEFAAMQKTADTLKAAAPANDSLRFTQMLNNYKDFAVALKGTKETFTIENEYLKAYISSKGGYIEKVELKNYQRPGQDKPLVLFEADSTHFSLKLNAYERTSVYSTDSFYFVPRNQTASSITLRLQTSLPGRYIDFSYSLKPDDYLVNTEIRFTGMQTIISPTEDQLQLNWSMNYPSQEKYIIKEREAATIYFKQDINDPDYINPLSDEQKEISEADVKWVCFKQQFFNSSIIADEAFAKAGSYVKLAQRPNSDKTVKSVAAELGVPYTHSPDEKFTFKFYFGPNHYNTLKAYGFGLENIIPMGWSVFSYINKWLVVPLFNSLSGVNMGLVILLLTVILKIVLLPIAYKTYMSGARMRVLKPELDAMNAKFGKDADPMKKQQEQMALYRKAGVNPMSGCLPLLLQFPILIALFNFVPAAIELRQQGFLWADDLSTYDSVWTFGEVPFINWAYGDHVSLFAMLMFVSTIFYTYFNSSLMPQQNNQMPGMKFMMYFMPVIFLAVMNRYSAGLSWYYFLANMFTFLQNWIFKKVISDAKIRAEIEANMKKPAKVSGFQKRLVEMAKRQQNARR